jgi:hypothetical protein
MATLVLLRHGESAWNAADVFTGWIDVRLSDRGRCRHPVGLPWPICVVITRAADHGGIS